VVIIILSTTIIIVDRMYEIDRENKILYEKLLNIHSKQAKKVDISGQGNLLHLNPECSF
jgi:hypothetical protein